MVDILRKIYYNKYIQTKQGTKKMTYKELQKALKEMKSQGLTSIALNATKEILQAEYDRLTEQYESLESLKNKREELVKEYNHLGNSANYSKNNTALDTIWELRKKVDHKIKEIDKKIEISEHETQIIKLNPKFATIRTIKGQTKTIKIHTENNVEDVIGYLNDNNSIKIVFFYYKQIFKHSELLKKRYDVYFPSAKELIKRSINSKRREEYYQSNKFQSELAENERCVDAYIKSLIKQ